VSKSPVAALWTPSGRGAIATIRVCLEPGSRPLLDALPYRAANGKPLSAQAIGRIVFGHWGTGAGEEAVTCAIDDRTLEIHCHGGEAAARSILRDLESSGCLLVSWPEALRHGELPLRAEIVEQVCRATTLRTAAILWEQANGVFESSVRSLIESMPASTTTAAERIRDWLAWGEFGLHLTRPWRVVLAGRPNVGKSSLINAILGYTRSVVFDQPGTTRDVVSASTAIDGWPIELSDTAGLRESADPLEAEGIERARATLNAANLVLVLIDISQPKSQSDRALIAEYPRAIIVAHKCDLPTFEGMEEEPPLESADWLRVSSKTGAGIDALVTAISHTLVPRVPPSKCLIPVTERQIALLARAVEAVQRSDALGSLNELLAASDSSPPEQAHSANRKGSPATS